MTTPTITFTASVRVAAPPEVTYGLLADPGAHLRWAGEQAPNDGFKLLTLDAPDGAGPAGTSFSSTGANGAGMTFQDRSTVTEASAPSVFAFQTDSRLVRKHRPTWQARFEHRYEVTPDGSGSRVGYRCDVYPVNYRPYWLHPLMRPLTRRMVPRMIVRNMRQLAMLAERTAAVSR